MVVCLYSAVFGCHRESSTAFWEALPPIASPAWGEPLLSSPLKEFPGLLTWEYLARPYLRCPPMFSSPFFFSGAFVVSFSNAFDGDELANVRCLFGEDESCDSVSPSERFFPASGLDAAEFLAADPIMVGAATGICFLGVLLGVLGGSMLLSKIAALRLVMCRSCCLWRQQNLSAFGNWPTEIA